MANIENSIKESNRGNKPEGWIGPAQMTTQLYTFADFYFESFGRERTFKAAAIKAGASESSAHALGHKWSRFTAVQEYWKARSEAYLLERQALHMDGLNTLRDLSHDEKADLELRKEAADSLVKSTDSAMYTPSKESTTKESVVQDESTLQTMAKIMQSIEALVGDSNA